jgi:hypothetical protein
MNLQYFQLAILIILIVIGKETIHYLSRRGKARIKYPLRKTCQKSEYLEIDQEILELSQKVLTNSEIAEANKIAIELTLQSKRGHAIGTLRSIIGMRPKRPIYYANFHLGHLPRWTRDAVTDLGDYIDQLVKYCVAEKKTGIFKPKSLGPNLEALKGIVSEELREVLGRFNKIIYVPAKHDFDVKNRRHRFTSKEVVFIVFLTKKLSGKIISISDRARDYSEDKIYSR